MQTYHCLIDVISEDVSGVQSCLFSDWLDSHSTAVDCRSLEKAKFSCVFIRGYGFIWNHVHMIETIACLWRFLLDTGVHLVLIVFIADGFYFFPVQKYRSASQKGKRTVGVDALNIKGSSFEYKSAFCQ